MKRQAAFVGAFLTSTLFIICGSMVSKARPASSQTEGRINIQVTIDGKSSAASITLLPTFTAASADSSGQTKIDTASGSYTIAASTTQDGILYIGHVDSVAVSASRPAEVRLRLMKAPVKPTSEGMIRIVGRRLLVENKPFQIRGVGYEPYAIGTGPGWRPKDDAVYRRDFPLLAKMHANTIRTWGQVDANLLHVATDNGLKVIAGYWVPYEANFADGTTRAKLIADFRKYVATYKSSPAMLMWSLGNEQNYQNGNSAAWYSLVNELAWAAYDQEGARYHPVTTPNGEIGNLGDPTKETDDASLTYLDAFGVNIYRGSSFYSLFQDYKSKSGKALWVSEYGVDSYDQRISSENQDLQAAWDVKLWKEIDAARAIAMGGTLMSFCDQWWKNGSPDEHNPGGPKMNSDADGIADEEYWGIVSIARNPQGGVDVLTPRKVYYALQSAWQP